MKGGKAQNTGMKRLTCHKEKVREKWFRKGMKKKQFKGAIITLKLEKS